MITKCLVNTTLTNTATLIAVEIYVDYVTTDIF